ncbi:helix-turn-helix domain-containing protein [Natronorubrum bangense]|uniref:Bacterio-opsin activator HTH domain-containing protein n=2 Tax=Natronorubrum bangense TaxID=61858 RepID=L9WQR6_9EURY|nr:helix-turn-helix domain-containing protein [Natronorubrum bangense]ELY51835.1 bacterio-opsin activator HTH domain-containing protein [Natronorubrum bangense JCM 10635]QCC54934.1 bacterio-opsin activator [Natronorubrum bangense]
MKSMRIELRYTTAALPPLHEGICDSSALEREVIVGGQAVDGVETITSFVYGDPEAYEPLLDDLEAVLEYEITPADDGFFLYLRRDLGPDGLSLLSALAQDTVVVVPPIEIRSDRTIRLTLVGHSTALTAVMAEIPDGMALDVRWVSQAITTTDTAVSDRQLAALQAAWDVGFYEVPREGGIEAVADELECAVSTASALIRRGEANAVERVLERGP